MLKKISMAIWKQILLNLLVITKENFVIIIRHFVKSNASSTSIPPLVTQENGHCQIHTTDYEKS